MTNNEYHKKTKYISKSLLDLVHKSPAHYFAYINGEPQQPTPAMIFGSLVHSVVFDQGDFAVMPECDRRTKEGKAIYEQFMQENSEKLIVTADQYEQALKIKEAVYRHPKTATLISQGQAEIPVFGEIEGMQAKCKVDFLNTKYNIIIDLKTTQSAAPSEFSKSIWNYRYHVQAAFYLDLTQAKRFFFIAVDKEAPHNVEIYELDEEAIERGRQEYKQDIETLKRCQQSGIYNGYTEDQSIHIISLPAWAK